MDHPFPGHSPAEGLETPDGVRNQLDIVSELARDLAGRFELEPLLARILRHITTLLECESGSISLVDEEAGTYTKKVDVGVGCQEGQTFPLNEGLTGQIVRVRSTVMLEDYSTVEAGHIAPDDPRWNCAVLGVPIRWGESIMGACIIFSARPGRLFTPAEARLAELFSSHAAIALANAELHAKAAERARQVAVSNERERAVRDVHETVGRSLSTLLVNLDEADKSISSGAGISHARSYLSTARTIAHDALTETRRTALGLGPASLEGRSLEAAIKSELTWVESMCSAVTELKVIGAPRPIVPEIAHQAFKIIQEALSNVVSHSRAAQVRVGLVYEQGSIAVLVEDNGRGFDLGAVQSGGASSARGCLGLQGMASRVSHLGGKLDIDSTPRWGTKVRAMLPDAPSMGNGLRDPKWKVLIVNDQPLISAGLVRLLHLNEPAIEVAAEVGSVAQLMDAYQLLHPDVVLVDLDMIDTNLTGVLGSIRETDPGVAIVVITDNPTVDQIRAAKRAGVRGYINRKSNAETIARVIVAAGQGHALVEGEMFEHLFGSSSGSQPEGENLTLREQEVRQMIAKGLADKQIATALGISVKTVEKHVGSLLRKTGARNRTMLVSINPDRLGGRPTLTA